MSPVRPHPAALALALLRVASSTSSAARGTLGVGSSTLGPSAAGEVWSSPSTSPPVRSSREDLVGGLYQPAEDLWLI